MVLRSPRRLAAPFLLVAGAALFGVGAGGIARVDAQPGGAAAQPSPAVVDAPTRDCPETYRGRL